MIAVDDLLAAPDRGVEAMVIAASADREIVTAARGTWPDGAPASVDSRFYTASVTKQLVAALVALAIGRGDVHEDDDVGQWIPGLPGWSRTITVSHLVHHVSGLPREVDVGPGARTTASVLEALRRHRGLHPRPAEGYEYSNDGYVLLAQILETATGMPLGALADRDAFVPLRLRTSRVTTVAEVRVPDEPVPPGTLGDGGWWSTPDDVLRWLVALNRGALGKDATALISTTTRLTTGEPVDYAWGARRRDIDGRAAFSHGGTWERWQSKTLRIPSLSFAVVVAARSESTQPVVDAVDAVVARALRG